MHAIFGISTIHHEGKIFLKSFLIDLLLLIKMKTFFPKEEEKCIFSRHLSVYTVTIKIQLTLEQWKG